MMKRWNGHPTNARARNIASLGFFIEVAILGPLSSNSLPLSKLMKDSNLRIGRFSADREYNEMMTPFVPFEGRAKGCRKVARGARENGVAGRERRISLCYCDKLPSQILGTPC
jgi:hypothetical protein